MNRIRFVIDASAAVKSAVDEADCQPWRTWIGTVRRTNADLLAPPLLRYELGNRLARESALSTAERKRWLDLLLLGFRFADPEDAFPFAPPLTYYDASYLALAQATQATLVSYDDKLLKAAKKEGIATLSP